MSDRKFIPNFSRLVEDKDLRKYRMKSGHIIDGMLLEVVDKEKVGKNATLVTFRPIEVSQ